MLNTKKIDEDDFPYAFDLFHEYILNMKDNEENNSHYYYQYEFDSSNTIYEDMMGNHCITINANSLKEANILNVILRCIIDGHLGSLMNYMVNDDGDDLEEMSVNDYFNNILKSKNLKNYKNYKSKTLKNINNNDIKLKYNSNNFNIKFNGVKIFTKNNILNLLKDDIVRTFYKYEDNNKYYENKLNRLQYIFDMMLL